MKKSASIFMIILTICFAAVVLFTMSDHNEKIIHMDGAHSQASDEALRIDINTATIEELMLLPDVGESQASKIVSYRNEHGPFKDVSDIQLVDGIGAKTYQRISPFLTVGGSS